MVAQEKNLQDIQSLNLRTLISSWLPFSIPLHLVKTSQHCRASARSTDFPKIHPGSYHVETIAHSKVRI